jgi:hypothetical protein
VQVSVSNFALSLSLSLSLTHTHTHTHTLMSTYEKLRSKKVNVLTVLDIVVSY